MLTSGPDTSTTCAATSETRDEQLAGTAAVARTWLLVEQPGPWGARALTGSRLDPELGAWAESAGAATGVRVALIRRPGRHADHHRPLPRRLIAAHTEPGRSWVRTALLDRPERLRDLPFDRLGAGHHGGLGEDHTGDPLTLVCTNGKRDRCCAVRGRPLAAELAASGGADVWEVTHLGGHRFAPTLLVLPYGYAYGRVSASEVKQVVEETRRGQVTLDGCRGRSAWQSAGQVADLAVRELVGERGADALRVEEVEGDADGWLVVMTHRDGRRWEVTVRQDTSRPASPASCGAPAKPLPRTEVIGVTECPPR